MNTLLMSTTQESLETCLAQIASRYFYNTTPNYITLGEQLTKPRARLKKIRYQCLLDGVVSPHCILEVEHHDASRCENNTPHVTVRLRDAE